jgi:NADH-quinone oxidoreductase subunit H
LLVVAALGLVLAGIGLGFLNDWFARAAEPLFWFSSKVLVFLFFFIWVRWSIPRFRYDQLMTIGWKLLLPVAAVNILITGLIVALRA